MFKKIKHKKGINLDWKKWNEMIFFEIYFMHYIYKQIYNAIDF